MIEILALIYLSRPATARLRLCNWKLLFVEINFSKET